MKKVLATFSLLLGFVSLSHAGTPQENYYQGQAPLSGATILASTSSASSVGTFTLTVSTPTSINSGGSTYTGRNCFTRFVVQVPSTTVISMKDNSNTVWTLYGVGIGASGVNTLQIAEDHLGPWCTAAGDQSVFTLVNTGGSSTVPLSFNVEGYTTYGGTQNQGPMY